MMSLFDFVQNNFWHVLPILASGVFALAVILERARVLYQQYPMKDSESFFERVTELVLKDKVPEAIAICDRFPGKPIAHVTKQALLRAHQPENLIESGIGMTMVELSESILKRTSFLATIANVATLLGLFGTIAGLIHSFQAVGQADPQQKSTLLAAGISTAMNATIMGLGVAIPCMVAFSFLINRTNRLMSEVDKGAMRAFDILKQRFYAVESEGVAGLEKSV